MGSSEQVNVLSDAGILSNRNTIQRVDPRILAQRGEGRHREIPRKVNPGPVVQRNRRGDLRAKCAEKQPSSTAEWIRTKPVQRCTDDDPQQNSASRSEEHTSELQS